MELFCRLACTVKEIKNDMLFTFLTSEEKDKNGIISVFP